MSIYYQLYLIFNIIFSYNLFILLSNHFPSWVIFNGKMIDSNRWLKVQTNTGLSENVTQKKD